MIVLMASNAMPKMCLFFMFSYYLTLLFSFFFDVLLEVAGYYLVAAGVGMEAVGEEGLYQFALVIDEAGGEVDVLTIDH